MTKYNDFIHCGYKKICFFFVYRELFIYSNCDKAENKTVNIRQAGQPELTSNTVKRGIYE